METYTSSTRASSTKHRVVPVSMIDVLDVRLSFFPFIVADVESICQKPWLLSTLV